MIERIGTLLVRNGIVSGETLDKALAWQRDQQASAESRQRIGDCLIQKFGAPEEGVYKTLAGQFGMTFLVDIEDCVSRDSMNDVSFDAFKDAQCLPLSHDGTVLKAAVSDPLDIDAILRRRGLRGDPAQSERAQPGGRFRFRR